MRLLITGASGSGTSTLARALAGELGLVHLEADDYYWVPTEPPYSTRRSSAERLGLLLEDLHAKRGVAVAGSIVGWGAALEDAFDFIVFLYLDAAIRVERLREREVERFGRVNPAFLDWAGHYDAGPLEGRSLAKHRAWLAERRCPVLEFSGDGSVQERLAAVLARVRDSHDR